jgi:hypothetical protein
MVKGLGKLLLSTAVGAAAGLLLPVWDAGRQDHRAYLTREMAYGIGAAVGALAGLIIGLAWIGVAGIQKMAEETRARRRAEDKGD